LSVLEDALLAFADSFGLQVSRLQAPPPAVETKQE
jgi:hypothetical protein